MNYLIEKKGCIIAKLYIQPRASATEIAGIHGDRLKIRIKAPPVEGKANIELIGFLSELIGIPKANIEITGGTTGRQKNVKLVGITKEVLINKLALKK